MCSFWGRNIPESGEKCHAYWHIQMKPMAETVLYYFDFHARTVCQLAFITSKEVAIRKI